MNHIKRQSAKNIKATFFSNLSLLTYFFHQTPTVTKWNLKRRKKSIVLHGFGFHLVTLNFESRQEIWLIDRQWQKKWKLNANGDSDEPNAMKDSREKKCKLNVRFSRLMLMFMESFSRHEILQKLDGTKIPITKYDFLSPYN